jgi:hypothetical protein
LATEVEAGATRMGDLDSDTEDGDEKDIEEIHSDVN